MSRKSLIASLAALLLVPALVYAGLNVAQVTTGPASGAFLTLKGFQNRSTVSTRNLSGYAAGSKIFYLRGHSANGYTAAPVVTNNGVTQTVAVAFGNTSTWTYTAPAKSSTQNINVSFKAPVTAALPVLNAVLPTAPVTVPVGGTATLSGQTSTILYLPVTTPPTYATATWSGAGLIFSPASAQVNKPGQVTTQVSAATAGTYTATLTLTAVGATTSTTTVTVVAAGAGQVASNFCLSCHTGWDQAVAYAGSVHSNNTYSSCQACHNPGGTQKHPFRLTADTVDPVTFTVVSSSVNGLLKGAIFCTQCHNGNYGIPHAVTGLVTTCAGCHTADGAGDAHGITAAGCTGCHSVARNAGTQFVQDNNGVRAITSEFAKWSHHVTGVNLNDAHCAACHLEGTVSVDGTKIIADFNVHMINNKTHLRNAHDDTDYVWDPINPTHGNMDNFCMSCHSATGATSTMSGKIQALINSPTVPGSNPAVANPYYTGITASATNPFGDTISNRYDKMLRPAVVNVDNQFDTSNNSHHGVKGQRYTGRTRFAGTRQISSPSTFKGASSATLFGVRSTMYDAGNLNALYSPLGTDGSAATGLGDDSTLHCGDCHTVGQWKVGSSDTANGSPTPDVIGAHGSNNEYLLRNTLGTDQRHTQNAFVVNGTTGVATYTNPGGAFLVCYNCHTYTKYGSIYLQTGVLGGHIGEYDQTGRCNGIGNTIPFNGYTTGAATDGTQFKTRFGNSVGTPATSTAGAPTALMWTTPAPYAGEQIADFGNVFGIQCANCHNSGAGNAYGGIHGSANNQTLAGFTNDATVTGGTYIDGAQNTTKIIRFLPGLGDASDVPGTLGGITGGVTASFLKYSASHFAYYSSNRKTGTAFVNTGKLPANYDPMPVRAVVAADPAWTGKAGSYNYTTTGVTNDTNWEQKHWQQTIYTNVTVGTAAGSVPTYNNVAATGAGCYTLGNAAENSVGWPEAQQGKIGPGGTPIAMRPATNETLSGPSQSGPGGPSPLLFDNWGGCDDHGAPVGGGNHGFVKKIIRPVTY